ncbi:MAG: general secretion pathway protein GspK [Alphaproteobacteria bacterium]|nr:general secretion pathway protein GspK [Alphaproteobacteria bacterium]
MAVLWILVLLSTLVLGFVVEARTGLRIVHNDSEAAEARAIADAGVTLAILGVFDPTTGSQWRGDGSIHALRYAGGTIQARVEDEDGKLDVNMAPLPALRNLFQILGAADPDRIAAAIDAERRATRSGAADPSVTGRPPPPAFAVLDDLRGLPGMTSEVYQRLPDFVTVYSGQGSVDPQTAPAEVLSSLPEVTPAQVQTYLASRAQPNGGPALQTGQQLLASSALRVFTIVSQARTPHGATFTRRAVVTLTGVPDAPYRFLAWHEGRRETVAAAQVR